MLYADANARWWRVVNPARLVVEEDDATRGMADIGGVAHGSSQAGISASSTPRSPAGDFQSSSI